ncbi:MAG: T9SS type A sorting domain-containing protein [Flavobacteriales bacterium]|nr:T9SS type A sorting domain-containing protein [Flavobacteriales bacterium]
MKKFIIFFATCAFSLNLFSQWKVVEAEYFHDSDPGLGNGIALTATDGNLDEMIEEIVATKVNSLSPGVHSLNVRVKDDLGNWGNTFSVVFNTLDSLVNVQRTIEVNKGEFFWDTDPGPGNGSALLAFDGNFDDAIEAIYNSTSNLPANGVHKLGVRIKDDNGWGPTFSVVAHILDPLSTAVDPILVDKAEYFWDNDPGAGNGNALLAFDGNFDEAIESIYNSTSNLPGSGAHMLGIRVKDGAGTWGPTFSIVTNILDSLSVAVRDIEVSKAEFFIDTDPGTGNASSLLAFDGNFDEAIEAISNSTVLTTLNPGIHTLNVRSRDGDNNWGPVFSTVFHVLDDLSNDLRNIMVVEGEGFWDADPGLGNGLAFIAFDGNFSDAHEKIEGLGLTGTLSVGAHTFSTRVKGADGLWGPNFTVVVHVLDALTPQIDSIFGPNPICSGGTSGQKYFVDSVASITYNWSVTGGIITSQSNGAVTVDWSGSGPYTVKVTGCNNWGCDSTETTIFIGAGNAPTANAGVDGAICLGDSLSIGGSPSASGGLSPYSYSWSNAGGLDNSISANPMASPATSTNYILEITDANGCKAKDTVLVTVNSNPSIGLSSTISTCHTDNTPLNSNVSSGTAPYTYSWTPGTDLSCNNCATPIFSANSNSSYDLYVADANGCVDSLTISVVVNPKPDVFITDSTDASCGQNDGESIAGVIGGTPSYTFLWSSGSTSAQAQNLAAGIYFVTATDSKGCTDVASVSIGNVGANITLNISQSNTAGTSCIGSATVSPSGGSTPYSYQWSTNPTQTTVTATGLCVGTYFVTVSDANGCSAIDTVTIQDTLSTGTFENIPIADFLNIYPNPNNGTFFIQLNAPSSSYNYKIYNLIGQTVVNGTLTEQITKFELDHLPSGPYLFTLEVNGLLTKRIVIR